jgi:hypothetical protein
MRVRTISSLQAGSGINEINLPATAIDVIRISAIKRILHIKSVTLYATSYTGLNLSIVSKILGIIYLPPNRGICDI